jgi:hypothetical protein
MLDYRKTKKPNQIKGKRRKDSENQHQLTNCKRQHVDDVNIRECQNITGYHFVYHDNQRPSH